MTILFADTERVLIDAISPRLTARGMAYPFGTRVPNPRPARFFRLLVTGGARANVVADNPIVTVESWAETETQAALMARTVRAVMEALAGATVDGTVVYQARDFSTPANLPDPTSAQVRYTSTGSVLLRGIAFT